MDQTKKAAVDQIVAKRDALVKERTGIRIEQAKLAQRDRAIDRELADCRAAARVFDVKIDFPAPDVDRAAAHHFAADVVFRTDKLHEHAVEAINKVRNALRETESSKEKAISAMPTEAATVVKAMEVAFQQKMPRISDIVLDRLRVAGDKGSKAAPIQRYIETTYNTTIHDKTVGMTLYRLQRDGAVRRDGHTWFAVPETANPGVAAPGLFKSAT